MHAMAAVLVSIIASFERWRAQRRIRRAYRRGFEMLRRYHDDNN